MQMLGLLATRATALVTDPVFEILDRIATYTELDEMKCHARNAYYCALIIGPVERADALRSMGCEGGRAGRDALRRDVDRVVCLGDDAPVLDCPVVAGSAFMMLTGGIDDDDGKNNSFGGVRPAVLVVPAGVAATGVTATDELLANAGPAGGALDDNATTAPAGARVPPAGHSPT
jgi:hypothetical protein